MKPAQQRIKDIVQWAKNMEEIRVVLLLGSQARKQAADQLSDIDLCLFTTHPEKLIENQSWLKTFETPLLVTSSQKEDCTILQVIYLSGLMAEFAIYPNRILESFQGELPAYLEPGYIILVDKDKIAKKLPKSSGVISPPGLPSPEALTAAVEQFWYNAYLVAKYLWRDELWRVKHYDWKLKQLLMQTFTWHAVTCRGQTNFTFDEGKHLKDWLDPEDYVQLMSIFGRFYPADSWRALDDTIKIFRKITRELTQTLHMDHFQPMEGNFMGLIEDLKPHRDE